MSDRSQVLANLMKPVVTALTRGGFRREKSPIGGMVILSHDDLGPHAKVSLYDSSIGWDREAPVQVGIIAGVFGHPSRSAVGRELEEDAFERAEAVLKRAGIRLQGTNPHSKVVRMAHSRPSIRRVAHMALRRHGILKSAGCWDDTPLGGDGPLDFLHEVENASSTRDAARLIQKTLHSKDSSASYGAMGVWDLVMSMGDDTPYYDQFKKLSRDVSKAAKGVLADYEWIEEWGGMSRTLKFYLENYAKGKPTGKLRGEFKPPIPQWYIDRVEILEANEDYMRVRVWLTNEMTDETKDVDLTANISDFEMYDAYGTVDEVFDPSYEDYGGRPASGQQSILLKINYYNDLGEHGTGDHQIDFNQVTGEPYGDY